VSAGEAPGVPDAVLPAVRAALADGPRAWVVGGAVRERLRGRATDDLDLAVDGDGEAVRDAARAVARRAGGQAFPLSDAFGAWRVTARPGGPERWQVDLTPLQGTDLAEDLSRRDLTVNALAEPVAGGPLVDLHGGRRDLQEGRLRLVAGDALSRDPVRVLRLARFAAELDAAPDDAALHAARATAPALGDAPGERLLPELLRALTGPRWRRGLEVLGTSGALAALVPGAVGPDGLPGGTTAATLERLLDHPTVPEADTADARALAERAADAERRPVLVLAALLADDPRPAQALEPLRPSRELRGAVGRVVDAARRIMALDPDEDDPRCLYAALGPARTDAPEAVLLARARAADGRGPAWAPLAARAVRWSVRPATAPVAGDVLARELGIRPGPELGALLRELAIAHDAGRLAGADEAVAMARRLAAATGRPGDADG
jgi:tRNA nucleotidyltransferase/poly(A) polymerase